MKLIKKEKKRGKKSLFEEIQDFLKTIAVKKMWLFYWKGRTKKIYLVKKIELKSYMQ